jgi:hypothetical protein
MGTWKRARNLVKALVIAAGMASTGAAHAVAMVQQQQQDTASAQSSGIVTPDIAAGFLKVEDWTQFQGGGGLAIGWCAREAFVGCANKRWLTPQDAVKKLVGPNARYAGFQVFILKDSTQLYLYYK